MKKVKAYRCKWCRQLFAEKVNCKYHEKRLCNCRKDSLSVSMAEFYSKKLLTRDIPLYGGQPVVWKKFNDLPSAAELEKDKDMPCSLK